MRLVLSSFALALATSFHIVAGQIVFQAGTGAPQPLSQGNSRARHTVTGIVTNAITGEPIRRALVRVNGLGQQFAFTGPDGRFQIDGVPEGQAFITAQKPGFFDESSARSPSRPSLAVMIGSAAGDLVVKLIPEATIQGKIVDSDGEPIESVSVQVIAQAVANGRKEWQLRGGVNTDEKGVYRLSGLQPGTYVVRTGPCPARLKSTNVSPEGKPIAQVYPPEFYPNARYKSSAQGIALKAGEEFQADFTLSPVRSLSIRGTVTGMQNGGYVICADSDSESPCWESYVDPGTGRFVVNTLPPGSWTLRFTSTDTHGAVQFAEQSVNLSTSDINGLQIQLQPLASIPVHVIKAENPNTNVQLELIPDKSSQNNWLSPTPVPDGSHIFYGVAPGAYRFSAQALGTGCIASITSGGVDLMRDDLIVSAGQQPVPIEVTLADNCASLSGSISGSEHANGYVILVSDFLASNPPIEATQPNGNFQFPNLRPGSYRLYAFADVTDLEYANPEVLRNFPSQQIDLTAGQKAAVQVELVSRGNP